MIDPAMDRLKDSKNAPNSFFPKINRTLFWRLGTEMDSGKFCFDQVEIFSCHDPVFFCAVTWNSANIHTEKRESDSPTGREKHGRLPRSFFTPYCCIPSTLAALSLIFTAFQNIIECTKAVSIAGRLYSPVVNETLQSPHAPVYSEWIFFQRHESCCLTYFKHCMKLKP